MSNCIVNDNHAIRQHTALAIRNHLKKRGHEKNITITPRMAKMWWKKLNIAVFNGLLKEPIDIIVLNWISDKDTYGECESHMTSDGERVVVIRLKKKLETRKVFLSVLVHEMVHQWEWENLGKATHHKYFYMWKDTIRNSVNLPLAMLVDDYLDE